MVCQVCGAKSGVYPLCAVDYKKYKKGVLVKCPTCSILHLKEDDCPRCSSSLLSEDLLIKKHEMWYWGTKLFAIAKGGKEQDCGGRDRQRYESVIEISTELQPFWADSEKPMSTVSKKQMFAWSEDLKNIANEGVQQSDDDSDISRYLAVQQLSEEIRGESVSYFGKLEPTTNTRPTVTDEEFVTDRDIAKRLVRMLDRAEKSVSIASPWLRGIDDIVQKLDEVKKKRNVDVRIIARPPESDKDFEHRKTVKELNRMGFNILTEEHLHAKMVLVDNKELYIGSANLTSTSMDTNLEVGIYTNNPEVVSKAAKYFERLRQVAFEKMLDSKTRTRSKE